MCFLFPHPRIWTKTSLSKRYPPKRMSLLMATRNPGSTHQLRLVLYPHYLQGFYASKRWLLGISEPSTVWLLLGYQVLPVIVFTSQGANFRASSTPTPDGMLPRSTDHRTPAVTQFNGKVSTRRVGRNLTCWMVLVKLARDLTTGFVPPILVVEERTSMENPFISGKSRLVKYHSLARWLNFELFWGWKSLPNTNSPKNPDPSKVTSIWGPIHPCYRGSNLSILGSNDLFLLWFFTSYHGKSLSNHHLGECFFFKAFSKHQTNIRNSQFFGGWKPFPAEYVRGINTGVSLGR